MVKEKVGVNLKPNIKKKTLSHGIWSHSVQYSSVQSLSCVWLFVTPWIPACQAPLSITNSSSWLKLMSIQSVMPSSHLILCCPLLLLPPIPPSIRVFSNESTLHMRCPEYWSFSFIISPSNEHPGLISFRMDWLGLLAVQGTLKSLLQHHSSKALIFQCSTFFTLLQLQIEGGKVEVVTDFLFLDSKITADGDYSHEIRRHLLSGRKTMTKLDSVWKSRNITLPTKDHIVKIMVFPVVT